MKKILSLIFILAVFSCSSKPEDPLILPPHFAQMPDLNNPETPPTELEIQEENVENLKELLLKSD